MAGQAILNRLRVWFQESGIAVTVVRKQRSILDGVAEYMELHADFTVSVYTTNPERSYIETPVQEVCSDGLAVESADGDLALVNLISIVSIEINERTE